MANHEGPADNRTGSASAASEDRALRPLDRQPTGRPGEEQPVRKAQTDRGRPDRCIARRLSVSSAASDRRSPAPSGSSSCHPPASPTHFPLDSSMSSGAYCTEALATTPRLYGSFESRVELSVPFPRNGSLRGGLFSWASLRRRKLASGIRTRSRPGSYRGYDSFLSPLARRHLPGY